MRKSLIWWTLFIGVGALFGGTCMLIEPDGRILGMDALLPYFQVLPFADVVFQDFVFSGIALIIVNGVTQLFTFAMLMRKSPLASRFAMGCGIVLMLWICIQFYMFPMNFMSTIYFFFGLAEAVTGYLQYKKETRV